MSEDLTMQAIQQAQEHFMLALLFLDLAAVRAEETGRPVTGAACISLKNGIEQYHDSPAYSQFQRLMRNLNSETVAYSHRKG